MKKLFRILLRIIGVIAVSGLFLVIPVDDQDFKASSFYKTTMDRLDSVRSILAQQPPVNLEVGWGTASITPADPIRLTGKNWTPYEQVFDTVFVRAWIFSGGAQKIAVLSYDLWIMHPHLAQAMRERIMAADLGITALYFTANHSHTSIGGWADGLLGTLIVGGNSAATVNFIGDQTLKALQLALLNQQPALVGYDQVKTSGMVINRLDTAGKLDEQLRMLKVRQIGGQQGVFSTYAAHSVFMNKDINTLSADYPGSFLQKVEALDSVDFASFAPGATGSHTPIGRKPFTREKMDKYSGKLAQYLANRYPGIDLDTTNVLKYVSWPVDMRAPHFRLTDHWRLRPQLFHWIMGREQAFISALRVGNTVLIGLPVELSGEYYDEFTAICTSRGLNLMITTFNGSYLGYVNPEKYYYTLKRSETREMNWYGPQAGEYYVSLINELLAII